MKKFNFSAPHGLSWGSFALVVAGTAMLAGSGCTGGEKAADSSAGGGANVAASGGHVSIDGSSTVFPIANLMGEDFGKSNSATKMTVNKSGTGSGLQKFTRGEIDIATASRPIEAKEIEALKKANIDFIEVPIAYDGVTVIVNKDNTWVKKLTPAELNRAWGPDSKVKNWNDLIPGAPAAPVSFFGPTDNHGTYEYFTEAINKKKGAIRKDYQANQEYNAIVSSVAGEKNGIAYVGYNYYASNKDKVNAVPIDGGKGPVSPTEETIANGTYVPLSRPLFLYINRKSFDRPEVKKFVEFALGAEGLSAVKEANYVQLPADALTLVKKHVADAKTGSLFVGIAPGMTIAQVLSKEGTAK